MTRGTLGGGHIYFYTKVETPEPAQSLTCLGEMTIFRRAVRIHGVVKGREPLMGRIWELGPGDESPKTYLTVYVFMWFSFSSCFLVEREQAAPPRTHAPYGLELAGTVRGDISETPGF